MEACSVQDQEDLEIPEAVLEICGQAQEHQAKSRPSEEGMR
jgi:hypothetical protein